MAAHQIRQLLQLQVLHILMLQVQQLGAQQPMWIIQEQQDPVQGFHSQVPSQHAFAEHL